METPTLQVDGIIHRDALMAVEITGPQRLGKPLWQTYFMGACSVRLKGSPAIRVIALPETMPRSQGRVSYPQDRIGLPALTVDFIPPLWIPRGKSEGEKQ